MSSFQVGWVIVEGHIGLAVARHKASSETMSPWGNISEQLQNVLE
jgi:hypothetical protein